MTEDSQDGQGEQQQQPPKGMASSETSLSETESLLIDMMKRQATVKAPSGGAEILAEAKKLGQRDEVGGEGEGDRKHAFWDTQPMRQEGPDKKGKKKKSQKAIEETGGSGSDDAGQTMQHCPIVPDKPQEELRQEPYNMPNGFEWSTVDINDEKERDEVYDLLTRNYVEDDDATFRFDYSPPFLLWALTPPGYTKDFHLGVRSSKSGKLMAFITAVPATIRAYEKSISMVEINFLCVHKKLRSKRLAPVLIKEITRRVNLTGVFQAVYTAGVVLPVPVASCRYYHRSLNPKKLVDIGFSRLAPRMTMARMIKLYKLPAETSTPNLRPMTPADVPGAHALLVNYLKKFSLCVEFSEEDFAHWMLPREGVITTHVACNNDGDPTRVTDLVSFYHLPSTISNNPRHSTLRAAYSYYNVATSVPMYDLMKDALTLAMNEDMDVFNALTLMENEDFLKELKFGIGDGELQYYLYNWACPEMASRDVGIVLL